MPRGLKCGTWTVADLNGDGKQEIVVGISEGLVVALSHDCQRIWSTRLPSPPVSLRCVTPPAAKLPWIVVGCDDGTRGGVGRPGRPDPARQGDRPSDAHPECFRPRRGRLAVVATERR